MRTTDGQIAEWRGTELVLQEALDALAVERARADRAEAALKEARLAWSLFDEPKVAGDLEAAKATVVTVWKSRRMWQDRALKAEKQGLEACDSEDRLAEHAWNWRDLTLKAEERAGAATRWAEWFAAESQYRKRVADALAAVRDSLSDTAQRIENILAGDPS